MPELDREGDDVDDVDLVGDTGSGVAPKLLRLPTLPRFVGVLGSLSIGTAGAKALLCTWERSLTRRTIMSHLWALWLPLDHRLHRQSAGPCKHLILHAVLLHSTV